MTGQLACHFDGQAVRLDNDDAWSTAFEMVFDPLDLILRQFTRQEIEKKLGDQLTAGHHAGTSSKWGARALRINSRARCNRLLTAGTLNPSISAISAFANPSISAKT